MRATKVMHSIQSSGNDRPTGGLRPPTPMEHLGFIIVVSSGTQNDHVPMAHKTPEGVAPQPQTLMGQLPGEPMRIRGSFTRRSTTEMARLRCNNVEIIDAHDLRHCGEEHEQLASCSREKGRRVRGHVGTRRQNRIGPPPQARVRCIESRQLKHCPC